jgi:glycosyltransferase involved in cell wall biosynthesis
VTVPLFSVIIPTYRRSGLLKEAVSSVLAQTVEEFECIVVDDASPDVPDVPDDPRVRLIRQAANRGASVARNTGIAASRGRYVTFLDDDDLLEPNRLEIAARGIGRAPVALCWGRFIDGPARPGRILEGDVRDVILDTFVPHVGGAAVSRDVIVSFDDEFRSGEDVEWWLRMSHAAPVTTEPDFGYLQRRHPGVRHMKGPPFRLKAHLEIISRYESYFADHPRAAAFRWKRIGLLALAAGEPAIARDAFVRSVRLAPAPATIGHLIRAIRAKGHRRPGDGADGPEPQPAERAAMEALERRET